MLQRATSVVPSDHRKIGARDFRDLMNKFLFAAHKRNKKIRDVCSPPSHGLLDGEHMDYCLYAIAPNEKLGSTVLRRLRLDDHSSELDSLSRTLDTKTQILRSHIKSFESVKIKLTRKKAQLISLRWINQLSNKHYHNDSRSPDQVMHVQPRADISARQAIHFWRS